MHFPTTLFIAAALAVTVPAFPQFSSSSSSDGTTGTITINSPAPFMMRAVTGAPYSGRLSSESVQTLPDGTHITRAGLAETTTFRDSLGRLRTERPAFPAPQGVKTLAFTLVEIQDPVAGYRYLLDTANRIAHRIPLTSRSVNVVTSTPNSPSQSHTMPDGSTSASESLGAKTLSGVTVQGTRITTTYPAGSRIGNDRPVTSTNETWFSPQLGVLVYSKSANFGGNENTMTLKDLSLGEPDPTLFQVPPGYQVVDETGSFTIRIQRRD